ncbi:MAG: enoyl-CoA hydratase/isomerase family protein [Melioribacteraceae bacterium]|nr:enoyl-CoA hydratase/isomerase family protein [Melioribacteraceae bacterium]
MKPQIKADLLIQEGYAQVLFHNPKGNSLPSSLLHEITNKIVSLNQNNDVKVIIIQSEGSLFCGGASYEELSNITDFEAGKNFFMGFADLFLAIKNSPKLIIAKIHGKCIGAGVGLAAACDYSLASANASIKLSELSLGIGPFVIGPVLERKIGISNLAKLAIEGEWLSAEWAFNAGLFSRITFSSEEMERDIEQIIKKLTSANPEALKELKNTLWKGTENWGLILEERAALSGRLVISPFVKDFINKFKESYK